MPKPLPDIPANFTADDKTRTSFTHRVDPAIRITLNECDGRYLLNTQPNKRYWSPIDASYDAAPTTPAGSKRATYHGPSRLQA